MDSVKRKVISELFLAPSVVLPIVGGISAGLLSWASGGSSYLTGAAIAGVIGGVGWMLTRMVFKVEQITESVMQAELDRDLRRESAELDELAKKLRTDGDHRTQDYLTLLRAVRTDFEEAARRPDVRARSARIREQVSQVFQAAVEQLRESYRQWELSENLVGTSREKILQNRELTLKEIESTIDRLQHSVEQFKDLIASDQKVDLASMREELEETMRVAKRTEERMRELNRLDRTEDYEQFLKE